MADLPIDSFEGCSLTELVGWLRRALSELEQERAEKAELTVPRRAMTEDDAQRATPDCVLDDGEHFAVKRAVVDLGLTGEAVVNIFRQADACGAPIHGRLIFTAMSRIENSYCVVGRKPPEPLLVESR